MNSIIKLLAMVIFFNSYINADKVQGNNLPRHNMQQNLWEKVTSIFTHERSNYSKRNIRMRMRMSKRRMRKSKIRISNHKISSPIVNVAKTKLGSRYVWGATGRRDTFDCSGLTQYVYKKNGINLPRTSYYQAKYGKMIPRNSLQPGDLIFFDTSHKRKGYVNHVGIYIGNNQFLHASSARKKVVISTLNKTFYGRRFKGARRPS